MRPVDFKERVSSGLAYGYVCFGELWIFELGLFKPSTVKTNCDLQASNPEPENPSARKPISAVSTGS